MSANGISHLRYKADRQLAKLELAQAKREGKVVADNGTVTGNIDSTKNYYRARNSFDETQLPTIYAPSDNLTQDVINNANIGGLIIGRPWILPVVSTGLAIDAENSTDITTEAGVTLIAD